MNCAGGTYESRYGWMVGVHRKSSKGELDIDGGVVWPGLTREVSRGLPTWYYEPEH
jgi:hypothetical protein